MKEKLQGFFTKERIKKILMGLMWYALSIGCLFIWEHREGGWTKDQWINHIILLTIAWIVWGFFHGRIQKKQEAMIAQMEAEAAARNAERSQKYYDGSAEEFGEPEYEPEAPKAEEAPEQKTREGSAESYAEQAAEAPEENAGTAAAGGSDGPL